MSQNQSEEVKKLTENYADYYDIIDFQKSLRVDLDKKSTKTVVSDSGLSTDDYDWTENLMEEVTTNASTSTNSAYFDPPTLSREDSYYSVISSINSTADGFSVQDLVMNPDFSLGRTPFRDSDLFSDISSWSTNVLQQIKSFIIFNAASILESIEKGITASYQLYTANKDPVIPCLNFVTNQDERDLASVPTHVRSLGCASFLNFDSALQNTRLQAPAPPLNSEPVNSVFSSIISSGWSTTIVLLWQLLDSVYRELNNLRSVVWKQRTAIGSLTERLEKTKSDLSETALKLKEVASAKQKLQEWMDRVLWHLPEPVRLQVMYEHFFGSTLDTNPTPPPPPSGSSNKLSESPGGCLANLKLTNDASPRDTVYRPKTKSHGHRQSYKLRR